MTTSAQLLRTLHGSGLLYINAGFSILPIGQNKLPNWEFMPINEQTGKKSWKRFQSQRATAEELAQWDMSPRTTGLAVACGDISGGIICNDFDDKEIFKVWVANIEKRMGVEPRELMKGLLIQSTSRGYQLLHRSLNPQRNQAYAWKANLEHPEKPHPLIETRENGGYCLLPPSVHPSGWIYAWLPGYDDFENIRLVGEGERALWIDEMRKLSQVHVVHEPKVKSEYQNRIMSLSRAAIVMKEYAKRYPASSYLDRYGYHATGSGYRRPDGQKQSVYVYDRDGVEVSWHHNTGDIANGVNLYGKPHDGFDWLQIDNPGITLYACLALAAEICGIEWETNEEPVARNEIKMEFHVGEGNTIILTDSPLLAEMLRHEQLPVLLGPTKVWERKLLATIGGFANRILVWAGDSDSANRTARELDAKVVELQGGTISFVRRYGINEFALALRSAHEPSV